MLLMSTSPTVPGLDQLDVNSNTLDACQVQYDVSQTTGLGSQGSRSKGLKPPQQVALQHGASSMVLSVMITYAAMWSVHTVTHSIVVSFREWRWVD